MYDEDGPEDLNSDGMITMMRVREDAGTFILHSDEPLIMKKVDRSAGEIGRYSLHVEGKDSDGDGEINEDAPGGVNLNRNMTYDYKPYTTDGGIHPFSSPEAKALGDLYLREETSLQHSLLVLMTIFGMNGKSSGPQREPLQINFRLIPFHILLL